MSNVEDRYTAMTGTDLAAELAERELPVSGKVDELRERLRADDAERAAQKADSGDEKAPEGEEAEADDAERAAQKDDSDGEQAPEGEKPEPDDAGLPEPREPVEFRTEKLQLTERQALELTRGEARVRAFTKHVSRFAERKYVEGDRVIVIVDPEAEVARVLPDGVEITLHDDEPPRDVEKPRPINGHGKED